MIRFPQNTNLILYNHDRYHGLDIQVDKGPFIEQYLERLYMVSHNALYQYPRVFAFRFDLRLPASLELYSGECNNELFKRFMSSFKAKIKHNRDMARQKNKYAHDSTVRYVWARESGQHGVIHYHVAVFLNYDAFRSLGKFELDRDNIYNRLREAWTGVLGLQVSQTAGLVEIPRNCRYVLLRNDPTSLNEFFYRASYLCKAATKVYGNGQHGFGASRT